MEYYTKLLHDIEHVAACGLSIQPRSPLLSEITAAIRTLAAERDGLQNACEQPLEKTIGEWLDIATAPKDQAVIGWCFHEADAYQMDNGNLTTYGAHCEGVSHVPDGVHILEFGGEYLDRDELSGRSLYTPNWWFKVGSDFEEVANPTHWMPLPEPPKC